jgi:putative addiction module component (TIGR02574 family)
MNQVITEHATELLKSALALPAETRAALADSLLESLDTKVDEDVEQAWQEEIQTRLQEIDRGAAKLVAWPDALRRLRAAQQR